LVVVQLQESETFVLVLPAGSGRSRIENTLHAVGLFVSVDEDLVHMVVGNFDVNFFGVNRSRRRRRG
jgi:hypothetical protein